MTPATPAPYPAHITPGPDEPVPTMITRLAAALRVATTEIYDQPLEPLWHGRPPLGGSDSTRTAGRIRQWRRSWEAAAELLGLPTDYLQEHHTIDGAAGRLAEVPRADRWRRNLICPRCLAGSIWSAMPLVTHCETCQLVLALDERPITATVGAVAIQRAQKAGMWTRFYDPRRLRRVRRLLHDVADLGWFDPPGPHWSPHWVNHLADIVWEASRTSDAARELTLHGMYERAGLTGFTSLAEHRAALHAELRETDLRACHVPQALPVRLDAVAAIETSFANHAASLALRREIAHAHSPYDQRPALHELAGPSGIPSSAGDVAEQLGSTLDGLRYLQGRVRDLVDAGRTDYVALEQSLNSLRRVPPDVLAHAGLPDSAGEPAAWWIRAIRSRCYLPHQPGIDTGALLAFDRSLAPEARLVLLEYSETYLGSVSKDVHDAQGRPTLYPSDQRAITDAG